MNSLEQIRMSIYCSSKQYVGQEEVPGNLAFKNKYFQDKMKERGWSEGQAWCAYAAELFWYEGYNRINPQFARDTANLFSANAIRTYNNLVANGFDVSQVPEVGDLVVWQSYRKGIQRKSGKWFLGHIGVVSEITDKCFISIEGNGNKDGGREGLEVVEKERKYTFNINNGLRLIGFIKPKFTKGL